MTSFSATNSAVELAVFNVENFSHLVLSTSKTEVTLYLGKYDQFKGCPKKNGDISNNLIESEW